MVFKEVDGPNANKSSTYSLPTSSAASSSSRSSRASAAGPESIKHLTDLASEFGDLRRNEGEAAEYGIYYDDTSYDYMQHLRDMNEDALYEPPGSRKGKQKERNLEDALAAASLSDSRSVRTGTTDYSLNSENARSLLGDEALGSEFVRKTTYQDMQDTPDVLGGFQPDMDPRLREVLEALEDEAYVEEGEEVDDFWDGLKGEGVEVDQYDWEDHYYDDQGDGEGWESDDTVKPGQDSKDEQEGGVSLAGGLLPPDTGVPEVDGGVPPVEGVVPDLNQDHGDGEWMKEFSKFKKDVKAAKAPNGAIGGMPLRSELESSAMSSLATGRRKKRKGALTATSGLSMSSSALHRTEGLSLLDDRFDRMEAAYAADDDDDMSAAGSHFNDNMSLASGLSGISGLSKASNMSKMSQMSGFTQSESDAPKLLRSDFDSIMDGFLGGHSMAGNSRTRVKKVGKQNGLDQLDEVRQGLGPPRFRSKAK